MKTTKVTIDFANPLFEGDFIKLFFADPVVNSSVSVESINTHAGLSNRYLLNFLKTDKNSKIKEDYLKPLVDALVKVGYKSDMSTASEFRNNLASLTDTIEDTNTRVSGDFFHWMLLKDSSDDHSISFWLEMFLEERSKK